VRILTASTEMGQGTKTIFPQLVAETLGLDEARSRSPRRTLRTSRLRPDRRVTDGDGRRRLADQGRSPSARAGRDRDRRHVPRHGRAYAADHGATRIDQQFEPYPGGTPFDDATYTGDAYPAFGWAACVAHVDVDLDTGEVHVRDVVAADDIGRVIHPVLAEGQVEGGTLQAVGYATIEEIKLRDGRYLNDRLATYIIPTALDAPRISTILVEAPFSGAPHGAKGVGELPMDVGAPAVVAAIADADRRLDHDLPATPERILGAMTDRPDVTGLRPAESAPARELIS
jgi:CO/xanthine dehydrogenase Mo-binding subunit